MGSWPATVKDRQSERPHPEVDPVCGMKLDPVKAAAVEERDGVRYSFVAMDVRRSFVRERRVDAAADSGFHSVTGKGVQAELDGRSIAFGNEAMMQEVGVRRARRMRFGAAVRRLCLPLMLLSPMIGAAAMSLSSMSVIGNALRLRSVKL